MDLKIRDVADLLQLSEATIRRWLRDGKIPAYRLNKQYRFSRTEIEAWMIRHKLDTEHQSQDDAELVSSEVRDSTPGMHHFSLYRAIHKGGVIDGVEGETKEEVICNSMRHVADRFGLDAGVLTDLLLDREQLMPTSLGHGVGVPHTRDFLMKTPYDIITVVYPKKPIAYGALDGQPVHTLFFLFACEDKRHLRLLAKLAHLCREKKQLALLEERPDQKRLLPLIKEWESRLTLR